MNEERILTNGSTMPPKRRWPRLRFRYSLRSLLFFTTVVAVWLGYETHRAKRQQRAVEAFQDECFFVAHGYQPRLFWDRFDDMPRRLGAWAEKHPHAFGNVTSILMGGFCSSNQALTRMHLLVIQSFSSLKFLILTDFEVDQTSFVAMQGLTQLRLLKFDACYFPDATPQQLDDRISALQLALPNCEIDVSGKVYPALAVKAGE